MYDHLMETYVFRILDHKLKIGEVPYKAVCDKLQ